jgi:hypothetical protein
MGVITRVARLFMVLTILVLSVPSVAYATPVSVGATAFEPVIPLLITAYKMTSSGTDIALIELYNTGNTAIDLDRVNIVDATNSRALRIEARVARGYVLPDTHVVVALDDEVRDNHTSYHIEGWDATPPSIVSIKTLTLTQSGYRSADIAPKAPDLLWTRTLTSTSYSTSSSLTTDVFKGDRTTVFDDGLYVIPTQPDGLEISEVYAYASDCNPLTREVGCREFIELHNPTAASIDLSDIVLRTDSNSSSRATSNTFTLDAILGPDEYVVITETDEGANLSLTNSGGYIWLEDAWGMAAPFTQLVHEWTSVESEYQGLSRAKVGGEWQWTTRLTPGEVNEIIAPSPVLAACPSGKYRNPETGRCRTIEEAVSELASCEEGYERNPMTNRCRKVTTANSASLIPCAEGYERNPTTNRCRSIASAVAELMPCDEGYERNPATNRCRKVQSSEVPDAPFAVEPVQTDVPVWQWWVGGGIVTALVGYGAWEWRQELEKFWARLFRKAS